VREYFLYDPYGEYLDPPLKGYRLEGEQYVPIEAGEMGDLFSDVLGLWLHVEGETLRLIDAGSGDRLLTPSERAAAAEAEISRLRMELKRLRQQMKEDTME